MLECFFPQPKKFFASAFIWALTAVLLWYFGGQDLGTVFGLVFTDKDAQPVIGLGHFATDDFLWFYIYFTVFSVIFYLFWSNYAPHRWQMWSILGSTVILFFTYFQVQVAVAVNNWYRPFYDAIQNALSNESTTTANELYGYMFSFLILALTYVLIAVFTSFFVSHYVFRWRTAMNDYYTARWTSVRHIEGASQRIQEDTMRFAAIMKSLGVSIVDAVMTLIAFLPVLLELSKNVKTLPIVGEIAYPLFYAAIIWSVFGTVLMIVAGIKLPGLEFRNQRVEAAFRKELVLGEDECRLMGYNIKRLRLSIVFITALFTGLITAYCGPIAFVGLAVPNLTRMLFKTQNHLMLLAVNLLFGAFFMLSCDLLIQLLSGTILIPINALTSLLGAPFVIYILIRKLR